MSLQKTHLSHKLFNPLALNVTSVFFITRFRKKLFDAFLSDLAGHLRNESAPSTQKISIGREWLMTPQTIRKVEESINNLLDEIDALSVRDVKINRLSDLKQTSLAIAGVHSASLCRQLLPRAN